LSDLATLQINYFRHTRLINFIIYLIDVGHKGIFMVVKSIASTTLRPVTQLHNAEFDFVYNTFRFRSNFSVI